MSPCTLETLDAETTALVCLAALIANGTEAGVRAALADAVRSIRSEWVDELLLQSYLFSGFPRALNAAREWRRMSPDGPRVDETDVSIDEWRDRGIAVCSVVYGPMYVKLRENVHALHPALDDAMIVDGYGRVLSRPGLDLGRRELCIVAACAGTGQDRQLHSHLHGALNVGVSPHVVSSALDALVAVMPEALVDNARKLLARVAAR